MEMKTYSTGFTLLEILMSVSIAGVMGLLIAQVFFTTARSNTKTELLKDVKQNGEYAIHIMERMIRNALKVSSVCSATGSSLKSIQILNPNGDTTTFGCVLDGSVTRLASTSASGRREYLTSSNVTIGGTSCASVQNSLLFECTSRDDAPTSIVIRFSLSQSDAATDNQNQASILFQTTSTSRN